MSATELTQIGEAVQKPLIDVVFIHGLGGDQHKTWQNEKNKAGDYWPKWVSEYHKQAAIWSVKYDGSPHSWFGEAMPITERAKNILALLASHGLGIRPIVFVTHSMGGIIVKQMLRVAEGHGFTEFTPFSQNTKAIIFVSVPHHGSDLANYIEALRIVLRPSVATRDLKADDSHLFELNEWFRSYVERSKLTVLSFHEEILTHGILVVSRQSADFGAAGMSSIGETLNHFDICKPVNKKSMIPARTKWAIDRIIQDITASTAEINVVTNKDQSVEGKTLSYIKIANIDFACVQKILSDRQAIQIEYFCDIQAAINELEQRVHRPQEFFKKSRHRFFTEKKLRNGRESEDLEIAASSEYAYHSDLLQKVKSVEADNTQSLRVLIEYLEQHRAPYHLREKALYSFSTFAALRMIRVLKKGYDLVNDAPSALPWFEAFKFSSEGSYCLFDRVPRHSHTGSVTFGYQHWVGARVGHERHYEYVMFPFAIVLPLFKSGKKGDIDAFYTWVLPQFVLAGTYQPLNEFPAQTWEAFLLQGAGGEEWWSNSDPCPWPNFLLYRS